MIKINYTPKMQTCTCCGKTKPETEFPRQSYTGAPANQCKECISIKRRVSRDSTKHSKFISKERRRGMEEPNYAIDDWRDAMLHFNGCCPFCGKPEGRARTERMDRDHLIAISRGGKTVRNNIIPACRKCNRGRGNKDWREWYREQPFYSEEREAAIAAWQDQTKED